MTTGGTEKRIAARVRELHAHIAAEPLPDDTRYYVPTLGEVDRTEAAAHGTPCELFAISAVPVDGEPTDAGDTEVALPLQSVSKVFSYALVLSELGPERVHRHVGVEPSGEAFTALRIDERTLRPFNPMVNAGALVTASLVPGRNLDERLELGLTTLRRFAGDDRLTVDEALLAAELGAADRNRGIAYLMRSVGRLAGDAEQALTLYLALCSVRVTSTQLAVMAATLANGGVNPLTEVRVLPRRRVRDVLSVMYTCGMYDYAGSWAVDVGLPAKSGVGGAIATVIPGKLGVATQAPGIDGHGNSIRGIRVARALSARLGLHVFATEDEDAMLTPAPAGPYPDPDEGVAPADLSTGEPQPR